MVAMPSDPGFVDSEVTLSFVVGETVSDISRESQAVDYGVGVWSARLVLPKMTDAESRPWRAFINSLKGPLNSFDFAFPDRTAPLGTGNGTPLVNGSSQTGSSIITDGWANSEVVLKAGDLFQIGDYAYEVESDVTSDGSGNATITFNPGLKAAPLDNAAITTTNVTTKMKLTTNAVGFITSLVGHTQVSFIIEEKI